MKNICFPKIGNKIVSNDKWIWYACNTTFRSSFSAPRQMKVPKCDINQQHHAAYHSRQITKECSKNSHICLRLTNNICAWCYLCLSGSEK